MEFNLCGWVIRLGKPKCNDIFEYADEDNDGKLSLNEFHSYYVRTFGKPPSTEQWIKFHLADRNNNGYITKYEMESFETNNSLL